MYMNTLFTSVKITPCKSNSIIIKMTIYKKISLSIVFLWFFTGGLLHFIEAEAFVNIMPSGLPWKYSAVYISGVFELIGAIGILFIGLRQWAGNGLFLLTLIVTPVNIHMWLHPELFPDARLLFFHCD